MTDVKPCCVSVAASLQCFYDRVQTQYNSSVNYLSGITLGISYPDQEASALISVLNSFEHDIKSYVNSYLNLLLCSKCDAENCCLIAQTIASLGVSSFKIGSVSVYSGLIGPAASLAPVPSTQLPTVILPTDLCSPLQQILNRIISDFQSSVEIVFKCCRCTLPKPKYPKQPKGYASFNPYAGPTGFSGYPDWNTCWSDKSSSRKWSREDEDDYEEDKKKYKKKSKQSQCEKPADSECVTADECDDF